jgi:cysteine-rich CPXCG protein
MITALYEHEVMCPYCGENITVFLDSSIEIQEYYEDCSVCCAPILFNLSIEGDLIDLTLKRDDE